MASQGFVWMFVAAGIERVFTREVWLRLLPLNWAQVHDAQVLAMLQQEGLPTIALLIVVNGIIMAAAQEWFFRGYLLKVWTERLGFWPAQAVVTLLFVLFHWNFVMAPAEALFWLVYRLPGLVATSLPAGYLWKRYGIEAVVWGHVLLNTVASAAVLLYLIF
jgi:membrane protease YdiL (CAAX protease family)